MLNFLITVLCYNQLSIIASNVIKKKELLTRYMSLCDPHICTAWTHVYNTYRLLICCGRA